MIRPRSAALVLAALVAGCGGAPPQPEPPDLATRRAELASAPAPTVAPAGAKVFDPADLDQLAEIYRRIQAGDNSVFAAFGLVSPSGIPDPKKVDLYYQAIQRTSQKPEDWKRLLDKARPRSP